MVFFTVLLVLLVEQARALSPDNRIHRMVRGSVAWAEGFFHAGQERHYGVMALVGLTGGWTLAAFVLWWLLASWALGLAWLLTLALLYLTIGFRQFSQRFTDMQLALNQNDIARAADIYLDWRRQTRPDAELSLVGLDASRLVRLALEHALVCAFRQVFAVLFWFMVLPGPSGAVLYRVSELAARSWEQTGRRLDSEFAWAARRWLAVLDWIPARLTALAYAVAGQFEESTLMWRQTRDLDPDADTLLTDAGFAAMGIRSSTGGRDALSASDRPLVSMDLAFAARLIWRALALWMGILLLLTVIGPFR
jgi:adenosylcobinamide-phosphate synthase